MLLVFYISSHGFGHATRDTEVINEILIARPDTRIVVRSRVPQWFLEQSIRGRFELQPCDTDTGMVQIDSLTIDVEATVRQAREFYADFGTRADREAEVLRALKPSAVIGDIPPLAFAAAARAGVPGIAFANFTWDWIYEDYDAFRNEASETLDVIRQGTPRRPWHCVCRSQADSAPCAPWCVTLPSQPAVRGSAARPRAAFWGSAPIGRSCSAHLAGIVRRWTLRRSRATTTSR